MRNETWRCPQTPRQLLSDHSQPSQLHRPGLGEGRQDWLEGPGTRGISGAPSAFSVLPTAAAYPTTYSLVAPAFPQPPALVTQQPPPAPQQQQPQQPQPQQREGVPGQGPAGKGLLG